MKYLILTLMILTSFYTFGEAEINITGKVVNFNTQSEYRLTGNKGYVDLDNGYRVFLHQDQMPKKVSAKKEVTFVTNAKNVFLKNKSQYYQAYTNLQLK